MAISLTSRYQRNDTALVKDRNGQLQLAVLRRPPQTQSLLVSDYRWRGNERVDTVSSRYYQSESAWWMFAEANPGVLDWSDVPAGQQIMVPRGLA